MKPWVPSRPPDELGMAAHTSNASAQEVEAGRSEIQGHPHFQSWSKVTTGFPKKCRQHLGGSLRNTKFQPLLILTFEASVGGHQESDFCFLNNCGTRSL